MDGFRGVPIALTKAIPSMIVHVLKTDGLSSVSFAPACSMVAKSALLVGLSTESVVGSDGYCTQFLLEKLIHVDLSATLHRYNDAAENIPVRLHTPGSEFFKFDICDVEA